MNDESKRRRKKLFLQLRQEKRERTFFMAIFVNSKINRVFIYFHRMRNKNFNAIWKRKKNWLDFELKTFYLVNLEKSLIGKIERKKNLSTHKREKKLISSKAILLSKYYSSYPLNLFFRLCTQFEIMLNGSWTHTHTHTHEWVAKLWTLWMMMMKKSLIVMLESGCCSISTFRISDLRPKIFLFALCGRGNWLMKFTQKIEKENFPKKKYFCVQKSLKKFAWIQKFKDNKNIRNLNSTPWNSSSH